MREFRKCHFSRTFQTRSFDRKLKAKIQVDQWRNDVKLTCMKTLPKMEISDELDTQINENIKLSELCKADVVRQALRIGLPQFASRFQPPPLWLEERIREALAERAEPLTPAQFEKTMKVIADGR
jgi:hypothetical protein